MSFRKPGDSPDVVLIHERNIAHHQRPRHAPRVPTNAYGFQFKLRVMPAARPGAAKKKEEKNAYLHVRPTHMRLQQCAKWRVLSSDAAGERRYETVSGRVGSPRRSAKIALRSSTGRSVRLSRRRFGAGLDNVAVCAKTTDAGTARVERRRSIAACACTIEAGTARVESREGDGLLWKV